MNNQNDVDRRRAITQASIDADKKILTLDDLCESITEKIKMICKYSSLSSPLRKRISEMVDSQLLEHEKVLEIRGPK